MLIARRQAERGGSGRYAADRYARQRRPRFRNDRKGASGMKVQQRPLWIRDLLDGRRRSVFDLTPAIERLNRELQHVEILEEAKQEAGRIFPIVTKAFMPGQHAERQFDGSVAPILVVRFLT